MQQTADSLLSVHHNRQQTIMPKEEKHSLDKLKKNKIVISKDALLDIISVCKVKLSEAEGEKYMQAWEEKYYEREEGREEGFREGLKLLIQKKLAKGKTVEVIADELEESVERIEELMKEL